MRARVLFAALALTVAGAGAAHALPPRNGNGGGGPEPCIPSWAVTFCADETANFKTWTDDPIVVQQSAKGVGASAPISVGSNETVDMKIWFSISANNDVTGGAVVDGAKLFQLFGGIPSNLNNVSDADIDKIKSASLWGHACKGTNDQGGKTLTAIGEGLYLLGAVCKANGDSSTFTVTLTHHSKVDVQRVVHICGPGHGGEIKKTGVQATFTVDVTPQHGGTLSNVTVSKGLSEATGTLNVSSSTPGSSTTVTFEGKTNCPVKP